MTEFIRARHPEVEGTALLASTAFKHLPGWVPVDETEPASTSEVVDLGKAKRKPRTTPVDAPIAPTQES